MAPYVCRLQVSSKTCRLYMVKGSTGSENQNISIWWAKGWFYSLKYVEGERMGVLALGKLEC